MVQDHILNEQVYWEPSHRERRQSKNEYDDILSAETNVAYLPYFILLCIGIIGGTILGVLIHLSYVMYAYPAPVNKPRIFPPRSSKY